MLFYGKALKTLNQLLRNMKVAFFDIQGWETEYLRLKLRKHSLKFFKEPLSINNVRKAKDFDVISVFIHSDIDKDVIKKLQKTRLIVTRSTGYDHIDINECRRKRITVCNIPTYGENTVAEHTFALILALSRKVYKAHMKRLRGDYSLEGLKGFDLKGKTIGIVGLGHIGFHVARIAAGFDMKILVFDVAQDPRLAKTMNFRYAKFDELLKKSDVITMHVPFCKATHHMINMRNIEYIKKGAVLINTSRGEIVETEALIKALDKGILKGVGLDVLEGEELIKEEKQLLYSETSAKAWKDLVRDHILLSKENVVFTPHMAFYSDEALHRILETTAENILCFAAKTTKNIVK